jgi:hypothetical protein
MGDPTCKKTETMVSYVLVGMHMYTFCGFADVENGDFAGDTGLHV